LKKLMQTPLIQFIVVMIAAALLCGAPTLLLPRAGTPVIFPHVQLPAETLFTIGSFKFTNSLTSIILADVLVILMALVAGGAARRKLKQYQADRNAVDSDGDDLMVPKGWHNTFEALVEYMYDLSEQVVGHKWGAKVFPLAFTIFILLVTANMLHFVPIVDTVGIMHCAEHEGYEAKPIGNTGIWRLHNTQALPAGEQGAACPTHGEEGEAEEGIAEAEQKNEAGDGGEVSEEMRFVVTPFMRTAATDMNLPLSIAIVAMVAVQGFGVAELGLGYFSKFFPLQNLKTKGPMGYIDLAIGMIEAVSESAKVLSFTLRLFGNIFAGAILLFVMSFLIPVGAPLIFDLLEVLIGFLQAFVFAMLTLVFVSVAQAGHGDHDDEHH
jgi:F-type H+-transporting ATPase subunit a